MCGRFRVLSCAAALVVALILACALSPSAEAYRMCTFRGTVVENGWRTMVVKSGGQCATVNVGWRTKYIPNRRPCLGERVAVDFILDDGYMKATKVVSLTPHRAPVRSYPPPPPSSTRCKNIPDSKAIDEACPPQKRIYSRTPPPHVRDRDWKPRKPRTKKYKRKPKPKPKKKPVAGKPDKETTTAKPAKPAEKVKPHDTLSGEVVASAPKSLSIRVTGEDGAPEIVNVRVGLKTKFIPFRRPAVGEKVQVDYQQENGSKFGHTVTVIQ